MNTNKKKKRIASIAVTLILTALFSIGVFAWFSISNQADVQGLALSAGTVGSLKVALDVNGSEPADNAFLPTVSLGMNGSLILNPVTSSDGRTFNAPVYTGNVVTALTAVTEQTKASYVYEKKYWLKVDEDGAVPGTYNIYLTPSNSKNGTYLESAADGPDDDAVNAIRISFEATDTEGNKVLVYEPGYGATNSEQVTAGDTTGAAAATVQLKQVKSTGVFEEGSNGNSPTLFKVQGNTAICVTMRVWIEGVDPDCANSIQLDAVEGKIQFAAEKVN